MTFIKSLKRDDGQIILKKINSPSPELIISSEKSISVCFLDTETTGVNRLNDQIIELAFKVVKFEEISGKIISIKSEFESFNQPDKEISNQITKLTGINDRMVANKRIDWSKVDDLLKDVDLIVAHNASFDRAFLDKKSEITPNKIWACTIRDIDWLEKGFSNQKQELLCYWHGFYFEAHRAMNDVDALIQLMIHPHYDKDRPILELIRNAKKIVYKVLVTNFSYNEQKKDMIKSRGYRWNTKDKIWYKEISQDDLVLEKKYLGQTVYDGEFRGSLEKINLTEKYKS
jgi:DNA polymerase-3 subunit epsilon